MVSVRRRQCGLNGAQGFDGFQEVNKWWLFIVSHSPGTLSPPPSSLSLYTIWPSGNGPAVKRSQLWANSVGRWPSMETKSHEGRPGHWSRRHKKTTRPRCRGESWGWGEERRDVCLDTEGQTTVNSLNLFSHALRESHTLQHTFHVLRPPPPHAPPRNKECEWRPTRNKRRRKTCRDQTDGSDPWGKLTSWTVLHSKHHRPAGSAASQTDTEGMSGEEEDDARVQQSHLIPPKTTE